MLTEVENFLTSPQRINEYTKLEIEDDLVKENDKTLVNADGPWPQKGEMEFRNVTMQYRETLEPSLVNLSFKVAPKMKVGIVGRTGAGKSSIL